MIQLGDVEICASCVVPVVLFFLVAAVPAVLVVVVFGTRAPAIHALPTIKLQC